MGKVTPIVTGMNQVLFILDKGARGFYVVRKTSEWNAKLREKAIYTETLSGPHRDLAAAVAAAQVGPNAWGQVSERCRRFWLTGSEAVFVHYVTAHYRDRASQPP